MTPKKDKNVPIFRSKLFLDPIKYDLKMTPKKEKRTNFQVKIIP